MHALNLLEEGRPAAEFAVKTVSLDEEPRRAGVAVSEGYVEGLFPSGCEEEVGAALEQPRI